MWWLEDVDALLKTGDAGPLLKLVEKKAAVMKNGFVKYQKVSETSHNITGFFLELLPLLLVATPRGNAYLTTPDDDEEFGAGYPRVLFYPKSMNDERSRRDDHYDYDVMTAVFSAVEIPDILFQAKMFNFIDQLMVHRQVVRQNLDWPVEFAEVLGRDQEIAVLNAFSGGKLMPLARAIAKRNGREDLFHKLKADDFHQFDTVIGCVDVSWGVANGLWDLYCTLIAFAEIEINNDSNILGKKAGFIRGWNEGRGKSAMQFC